MAGVEWSAIEALVEPLFDEGGTPDRADLVEYALAANAADDVIDALDTLGPRPVPSLDALKDLLTQNGAVA